jgi:hypothetical protein
MVNSVKAGIQAESYVRQPAERYHNVVSYALCMREGSRFEHFLENSVSSDGVHNVLL